MTCLAAISNDLIVGLVVLMMINAFCLGIICVTLVVLTRRLRSQ